MNTYLRYRNILLFAICVIAVLFPAAIAVAACPLHPAPPCGSPGFTGRVGTSARCGRKPLPVCHTQRGPRGPRGLHGTPGKNGSPGQPGSTGATGSKGATGPSGLQGVQGETGAAGSLGAPGSPGATGAVGSTGPQGVSGEVGATGLQGLEGVQGEVGAAGETGATGSQGEAGTNGTPGAQGVEGLPGEIGATGVEGPAGPPGAQGAQGEVGPQGTTGAEGAQGAAGAAGATGATGPAGSNGLSQYAYIYNLGGETVPLEADVTFDSNGVMTPGVTHALGFAGITLMTAGTYEVTFSVSGTESSQMALFVNGTLVPGAVYGSGAGTQQNTGQAIFIVPAGAVLTVRNHTSSAAVGLATPIGGTQASANASVVIEKLA